MKITLTKPQHKVSSSKKRFRVLVSGRRFGKTYLCITEMMKYAAKVKQNIWYVAPTFKMAREIVWSQLKEMLYSFNWIDNINESNLTITIKKTGSKISLKGCENYDGLRGTGLNFLILDEFADIDEKAWTEVLRASVADTEGDVLMCGSPKGYGNWAYRMYMKGQEDNEWDSFQFTTLEGGMVSQDEIEQAKQDIDIRTFRQEFEGTFENYAGAVYYNFHPVDNVKKKEIDWSKPLHIGLDFNVDPMSASIAQIDKDIIHFIDEIVIYSSNTDEMVQEIKDRYGSKMKIFMYPDPACRQRKTSAGGRTDLTILQNAGFNVKCKLKHSPIRDRINAVNSRLKDSNGKRYIYVNPSCKTIIKGLQRQIYKENTNIPDKAEGFDHMNDSIGYLIEIVKPLISQNTSFKPQRWAI
jgi:phage terminase large subunit